MLRRRPAAIYELLAEDEFLERGRAEDEPDGRRDDGGPRARAHEQVAAAAASTARPPAAAAGRTLLVALTAAALVGFAVWELLGIASDSVASRPGAAFQAPHPDVAQLHQRARRGSQAHQRGQRRRPLTQSLRASRSTPAQTPARAAIPVAPAPPIPAPAIQPGGPALPNTPIAPAAMTATSLAEQEFGFER